MNNQRNWGTDKVKTELKYSYEKENNNYDNPVVKRQMSKEELEDYLKGLELKCKWKQKKIF